MQLNNDQIKNATLQSDLAEIQDKCAGLVTERDRLNTTVENLNMQLQQKSMLYLSLFVFYYFFCNQTKSFLFI